ncbi:hypothetical protein [Neorhodopirellula lusitana]|uniref:hypothetical protein n=1 Tax=Neorhodopirellula lusitana TaxID=445327 RepID=UPI0038502ED6
MVHNPTTWVVVAVFFSMMAWMGGDAFAQCSGGRGGPPTGSQSTLNSNLAYASNPLISNPYSQTALIANQYQQQSLATQQRVASLTNYYAERERLAAIQREAIARPYRLARAEAKRAARAARIAERLREQGRSSSEYMLTSTATSDWTTTPE